MNLPDHIARAEAALADLFDRHGRAALAFSGGKDSLTLLHLCRPWRDRLTILWVNTGAMYPHMETFVRSQTEGWNLVEIRSDVPAYWEKFGIPASVLPTDHAIGGRGIPTKPLISPWSVCCTANLTQPMAAWMEAHPDVTGLLVGQRHVDYGRFDPTQMQGRLPLEVVAPLWAWTDDEIWAYVDRYSIELPEQYALGWRDSAQCAACPVWLKPEQIAYQRRRYPQLAQFVEQTAKQVYELAIEAARHELDAFEARP